MRVAVWGAVLGAGLGLASTAAADIYRYRTRLSERCQRLIQFGGSVGGVHQ